MFLQDNVNVHFQLKKGKEIKYELFEGRHNNKYAI